MDALGGNTGHLSTFFGYALRIVVETPIELGELGREEETKNVANCADNETTAKADDEKKNDGKDDSESDGNETPAELDMDAYRMTKAASNGPNSAQNFLSVPDRLFTSVPNVSAIRGTFRNKTIFFNGHFTYEINDFFHEAIDNGHTLYIIRDSIGVSTTMLKAQPKNVDKSSEFPPILVFNRKLGVGIFRGDIEPKSENAENVDGIVFQLLLLVTLGRKSAVLMRKFDEIFLHALRLTFDLPPPIACHVNGIFLRCEMNPGKGLEKEQNPYGNLMDLPIMAKLEIWIGDRSHKEPVLTTLISELRARIDKLEIPSNTFRPFIAINRVQHWTKEAQKCNTTPNFMSYPKRSFKRIVLPFHKETKVENI
ncbi:hypothetical protein GPALN_012173 [Globodera pallida]|nr:hypothetical protein GPALN_012173 [Globodera pallida]